MSKDATCNYFRIRDAAFQRLNCCTTWDNTFDIKYGSLQTTTHTLSGKNDQFVEGFEPGRSGLLSIALTTAPTGIIKTGCKSTWHCQCNTVTVKGEVRNFSRGRLPAVVSMEGFRALQGRAPKPFFNFQGRGSIPIFGRFNGQNEKNSWPGGMTPLPLPAYAYHIDSIALYITEKQLYNTFNLGIDCKVLVKVVGNR